MKCKHFCVDCERNDRVDIKCGGPEYLGYDFFIPSAEVALFDFKSFIEKEIKKNGQPLIRIGVSHNDFEKDDATVWDIQMITKCIKKGYN